MAVVGSPLVLELGLGVLILLVFLSGLFHRSDDRRSVGVVAVVGLTVLLGLSWERVGALIEEIQNRTKAVPPKEIRKVVREAVEAARRVQRHEGCP